MRAITLGAMAVLLAVFIGMAAFALVDPAGLASVGTFGSVDAQSAPGPWGTALLISFILALGTIVTAALFHLSQAFASFATHEGISPKAAHHLARCGQLLLVGVLFGVLVQMPISVILTWNNPPGERALSVTFGSVHLLSIVCGGAFLALAGVLKRASALSDELKYLV